MLRGAVLVFTIVAASTAVAGPRAVPTSKVATDIEVLVQYQRVGRALMKLDDLRGREATADLWPRFRTIKIEKIAGNGPLLDELKLQIDRRMGIELSDACLKNPLAEGCS